MQALDSWREEKRSAYLYRIISDQESGTTRQLLFLELARAAEEQAAIWAEVMRQAGGEPPAAYRPDVRTRLVGWLVRWLGVAPLRGLLSAMKVRGMSLYHAPAPHGMPTRADFKEPRHRTTAEGGNLRAAVFGVNDGLVSNTSLILGVAGAGTEPGIVVLSGVAGLLAGALSMAAGEYVSVRAQREFFEYQISLEREELDQYPQAEAAELALIFAAKGVPPDEAKHMAEQLIRDPDRALDTLAREELGLNPAELGSPWGAAISSFLAFSLGAALPLLPFLMLGPKTALAGTVLVSGVGLYAVGSAISLFTGQAAWRGGLRMLAIGGGAGLTTWLIGRALGVTLG
ncbi:MAG: VIT1/CCC1 transporter family protein [Thiobacillaceae bacterium]|nr:VIT1/CCC1 transporter family protein [Thiobacillaceae bacterium]MDW8323442.1 VIT1/CCC1 transporter family protein [Burkholderiales bacterium]